MARAIPCSPRHSCGTQPPRGARHVAFTAYQTEDDTPWASPQAHVYMAGTSDKASCPYLREVGSVPAGGGVIIIPQFYHR